MLLPSGFERLSGLIAALLIIVIAGSFFAGALGLDQGTPGRPGPGALPLALSAGLGLLGISWLVFPDSRADESQSKPVLPAVLRSAGSTIAGMLVFSFTVRPGGLVPAVFLSMLAVTALDSRLCWHHKLLLVAGLGLFAWVLFIAILGLPVSPFAEKG